MARPRRVSPTADRPRRLVVVDLRPGALLLERSQGHYLRDVLRLEPGAELQLLDRRGARAIGTVVRLRPEVLIDVGEVSAGAAAAGFVTVALSLPKGERADWAVEKLAELGVAGIVWLDCQRSVASVASGAPRFLRWQRLIDAAVAQSGTAAAPQLLGTLSLAEVVELPADWRLLADRRGALLAAQRLPPAGSRVTLMVGPEGGFTSAEQGLAEAAGFVAINLTPTTLRVETAAVVGTAMILAAVSGNGAAA